MTTHCAKEMTVTKSRLQDNDFHAVFKHRSQKKLKSPRVVEQEGNENLNLIEKL
jgi:hypothetical protein